MESFGKKKKSFWFQALYIMNLIWGMGWKSGDSNILIKKQSKTEEEKKTIWFFQAIM